MKPDTRNPESESPVFMREFRSRMRRPWAYWVLLGYLLLIIPPSLYFLYHVAVAQKLIVEDGFVQMPRQGGVAFALILFSMQFLLVTVLAPALSCASFAAERVRRRLVFLLLTPLPSRQIILGKLYFVLFYLLLLLLATVPLCALASMFGGLSPLDILAGYALLAAYALCLGACGIFISARVARPERAALWTYLAVLAAFIAIPWLSLPLVGLVQLISTGDPAVFTRAADVLPIPLIAIPGILICWLAAEWFIGETTALLDTERRMWGTCAPPLPLHLMRLEVTPEPPPTATSEPLKRRW